MPQKEIIFRNAQAVEEHLRQTGSLAYCTLQGIDFTNAKLNLELVHLEQTSFLGCTLPPSHAARLQERGAVIYPIQPGLPYNPFRNRLYTWQELSKPVSAELTVDWIIYQHFYQSKNRTPVLEALSQRIHDHSIDVALKEYLGVDEDGMTAQRGVGFMGGHSTRRDDPNFARSVQTAKLLTEAGYLVISGGGPGIMEAANLGAYLAGQSDELVQKVLDRLKEVPHYKNVGYVEAAEEVLAWVPNGGESIAIPTWFYGHEPSNLFASGIAKYFSNSIREDNLLALSLHGIVFAPGSAGTTQEIFQDATQNHYGTFNYYSPMVFLGTERYTQETKIYPLLQSLAKGRDYAPLLHLTNEPKEVVRWLQNHPPIRKEDD
ncbi:MAG: hypothetical protein AAFU60_04605 [Bacteroidota bacterium]